MILLIILFIIFLLYQFLYINTISFILKKNLLYVLIKYLQIKQNVYI